MADKSDEAVMNTNDDATISKWSAAKLGYFRDDFVGYFCKRQERKPPIINRGYYARVAAMRKILKEFIRHGGKQIVSLGAGFDTNYFVLQASSDIALSDDFSYIEIDFSDVTLNKISTIRRYKALNFRLKNPKISNGDLISDNYCVISGDLRSLEAVKAKLRTLPCFDTSKPTLFLSECVLIYMTVKETDDILKWIASDFSTSGIVVYEQIRPHDRFGLIMQKNLQARGCPLQTLLQYPDLPDQVARFKSAGFTVVDAFDMKDIWNSVLDQEENKRVEAIEMLDELEEWNMFQEHYCMVVAAQDKIESPPSIWASFNLRALSSKNLSETPVNKANVT